MLYTKPSSKTIGQLDQALRESAARHSFGVLAVHDLRQTMNNKGVPFDRDVRVYEVCNPHHAAAVLGENIAVSTALPCRISVYAAGAALEVATILPTELMQAFATTPAMAATAAEVERAMKAIIDAAV